MKVTVNENRIREEFARLTAVDSVSFREKAMAELTAARLEELGCAVWMDQAQEKLQSGGNLKEGAGNVYGFLKGSLPGPPILLSAHLDTVEPGIGKRAVFCGDGRITSDGTTVLGADDAAGIVEILEGIRCLREAGVPHRDVEILFFAAEEAYTRGSAVFDYSWIRAKEAYVLDLSGPVGRAAFQAPTLISFRVTVTGRAAHAGFAPEEGIHAIAVMCEAIAGIRQGRLAGTEQETTLNIGRIRGGEAPNIVPECCSCEGEIRSYSHAQALAVLEEVKRSFSRTAERANAVCRCEAEIPLTAYRTPEDSPVVHRFWRACRALGLPGTLEATFGGSDNNSLALHGISGLVLSCGMYRVHSVHEYTTMEDLKRGALLVAHLLC